MSPEEFEAFRSESPVEPTVSVAEVAGPDRTLLRGLTVNEAGGKDELHVYLLGGLIHVVEYREAPRQLVVHLSGKRMAVELMVPTKRAYPELTDAVFAEVLRARGGNVWYAEFDRSRYAMSVGRSFQGAIRAVDGSLLFPALFD